MMISKLSSFMIAFITFSAAQAGGTMVPYTGGNANNNSKERTVATTQNTQVVDRFNRIVHFTKAKIPLKKRFFHIPEGEIENIYKEYAKELGIDNDDIFWFLRGHSYSFKEFVEKENIYVENQKVYLNGKEYTTQTSPYPNLYGSYKVGREILKRVLKDYIYFTIELDALAYEENIDLYISQKIESKDPDAIKKYKEEKPDYKSLLKRDLESTLRNEILYKLDESIKSDLNSPSRQNTFIVQYMLFEEMLDFALSPFNVEYKLEGPLYRERLEKAIERLVDLGASVDIAARKHDASFYLNHESFSLRSQAKYCMQDIKVQSIADNRASEYRKKIEQFNRAVDDFKNNVTSEKRTAKIYMGYSFDDVNKFDDSFYYNTDLNSTAKEEEENVLKLVIEAVYDQNFKDESNWEEAEKKYIEYIKTKKTDNTISDKENMALIPKGPDMLILNPMNSEQQIIEISNLDPEKLESEWVIRNYVQGYSYNSTTPLVQQILAGFLPRTWAEENSYPFARPLGVYPKYITISELANLIAEDFNLDLTKTGYVEPKDDYTDTARASFIATLALRQKRNDEEGDNGKDEYEDDYKYDPEENIRNIRESLDIDIKETKEAFVRKRKAYIYSLFPSIKSLDSKSKNTFIEIYNFVLHRILRRIKDQSTYYLSKSDFTENWIKSMNKIIKKSLSDSYNSFKKDCNKSTDTAKLKAWIKELNFATGNYLTLFICSQVSKKLITDLCDKIDSTVDKVFRDLDTKFNGFCSKYHRWASVVEMFKQAFINDNIYLSSKIELTTGDMRLLYDGIDRTNDSKNLCLKLKNIYGEKTPYYIDVFMNILSDVRYKKIKNDILPNLNIPTKNLETKSKIHADTIYIINDVINILEMYYDKEDLVEKIINPNSLFYKICEILKDNLTDYSLENGSLYIYWRENHWSDFYDTITDYIDQESKDLRTDKEGMGLLENEHTPKLIINLFKKNTQEEKKNENI